MHLNVVFWILVALWLVIGGVFSSNASVTKYRAGDVLLAAIIVCLGWGLFHAPINA